MSKLSRMERRNLRRRKRRRRIFFFIVLPILLIVAAAGIYGASLLNKAELALDKAFTPLEREGRNIKPNVDNVSVLIMGVDDSSTRGFESSARTDALLVATFNKKENSIKLLSIPRDSYVYIPEVGYKDKINHAHAYGGPLATIETIEELLDIPIDFYVKINFEAFIEIVDALGGIEMYVPISFTEQDSKDRHNAISLKEGYQHLNGEEALALARTRKIDNDYERGKRQQEILKAIIKKAASIGSIPKYSQIIDSIGDNMETDITSEHALAFAEYLKSGLSLQIDTLTLEGEDLWIPNKNGQNIYYYGLDEYNLAEVKSILQSHLELDSTNFGQNFDHLYKNQAQNSYGY